MDFRRLGSACNCLPASMASCRLACPERRQGLACMQFFCGTVAGLGRTGFTFIFTRSRFAHGAHGSTFIAHDAGPSLDLARHTLEATAATVAKTRGTDGSLTPRLELDRSLRHFNRVAYSFDIHARIAVGDVAWNGAGILSRDRASFLVASG